MVGWWLQHYPDFADHSEFRVRVEWHLLKPISMTLNSCSGIPAGHSLGNLAILSSLIYWRMIYKILKASSLWERSYFYLIVFTLTLNSSLNSSTCDTCGGTVKVIADTSDRSIEDPAVIKQILAPLEKNLTQKNAAHCLVVEFWLDYSVKRGDIVSPDGN